MRAVIDTNVLVSGLINPRGAPGRIVDHLLAGAFTALYDDRVLAEYRAVLVRSAFGFSVADVDTLVDAVERDGEAVEAGIWAGALPDPTDLPFLEVAVAGRADALVTGNSRHFRPRRGRHAVSIMAPAAFVTRMTYPRAWGR
jgi:putative PIN family toxin of toxin-antitoxin system